MFNFHVTETSFLGHFLMETRFTYSSIAPNARLMIFRVYSIYIMNLILPEIYTKTTVLSKPLKILRFSLRKIRTKLTKVNLVLFVEFQRDILDVAQESDLPLR